MWPMRSSRRADLLQSRKNGGKTAQCGRVNPRKAGLMRLGGDSSLRRLAACTQRPVTVPDGQRDHRGAAGRHRVERRRRQLHQHDRGVARRRHGGGRPGSPPTSRLSPDGTGPALDDDKINLMQWTLEQQKIDAANAQRDLDAAAASSSWCSPGRCRSRSRGANVALYRQAVDQRRRPVDVSPLVGARVASVGSCGRYRDADAAQRAFLAAGGPDGRPARPRSGRRRLRLQLRPGDLSRAHCRLRRSGGAQAGSRRRGRRGMVGRRERRDRLAPGRRPVRGRSRRSSRRAACRRRRK